MNELNTLTETDLHELVPFPGDVAAMLASLVQDVEATLQRVGAGKRATTLQAVDRFERFVDIINSIGISSCEFVAACRPLIADLREGLQD